VKNPNPQDGYAPDLFSEHARAAQLGLRVLEILAREWADGEHNPATRDYLAIRQAARHLGLLKTERA